MESFDGMDTAEFYGTEKVSKIEDEMVESKSRDLFPAFCVSVCLNSTLLAYQSCRNPHRRAW